MGKQTKGFTLVELIAVIVVLAVILAITVPVVSNVIRSSTMKAFESDAKMVGNFSLVAGTQLKILVGQRGGAVISVAGGGGGTFVTTIDNTPMIVAGGGGGAGGGNDFRSTSDATNNTMANDYQDNYQGDVSNYRCSYGFSGGGFNSDGEGGIAYVNGGAGGDGYCLDQINTSACSADSLGTGYGGFGGGGGSYYNRFGYMGYTFLNFSAGGGGGYSGGAYGTIGNGGGYYACGGGGSYNSGTNQINTAGFNSDNGRVIIIKID